MPLVDFEIEWIDFGRAPQCKPDPAFPDGKDVDISNAMPGELPPKTCTISLAHPAKRCGLYVVTCKNCGLTIGLTTAGRPDDPRSLTIACKG